MSFLDVDAPKYTPSGVPKGLATQISHHARPGTRIHPESTLGDCRDPRRARAGLSPLEIDAGVDRLEQRARVRSVSASVELDARRPTVLEERATHPIRFLPRRRGPARCFSMACFASRKALRLWVTSRRMPSARACRCATRPAARASSEPLWAAALPTSLGDQGEREACVPGRLERLLCRKHALGSGWRESGWRRRRAAGNSPRWANLGLIARGAGRFVERAHLEAIGACLGPERGEIVARHHRRPPGLRPFGIHALADLVGSAFGDRASRSGSEFR